MRNLFVLLFIIIAHSINAQQLPQAGIVPLGFKLKTVNKGVASINCQSTIQYASFNLDQCDTLHDFSMSAQPDCGSLQKASAYFNSGPNFALFVIKFFATQNYTAIPSFGYQSFIPAIAFNNTNYNPDYYYSTYGFLNTSGTYLGGNCAYTWTGNHNYQLVAKKFGNEFLYGWMTINTAGGSNGSGTGAQLYFNVIDVTLFPKFGLIKDTINCTDSYTFPNGLTLNNLLRDTVYDCVLTTSDPNCDSLVRTRLLVVSSNVTTLNLVDSVCGNQTYTFFDGSTTNLISNTNFNTIYNVGKIKAQNGCDSVIVNTTLTLKKRMLINNISLLYLVRQIILFYLVFKLAIFAKIQFTSLISPISLVVIVTTFTM